VCERACACRDDLTRFDSGQRKLILCRDHCWSYLRVQALSMIPGCSNALKQPGIEKLRLRQRIWDASQ
jgi:hypothetical protein